jgi:hypothetical protein
MSMARVCVKAISPGLAIGPPACSLRSAARPSQNWATFRLELSTVGELIGPCCQLVADRGLEVVGAAHRQVVAGVAGDEAGLGQARVEVQLLAERVNVVSAFIK